MSYTEPLSITIASSTIALPRTRAEGDSSKYTAADGMTEVLASHEYGKRTRRVIRLNYSKIAPDVFDTDENVERSMSVFTVFDLPTLGFTNVEVLAAYTGFKTMCAASSDLLITKLLGGES